VTAVNAADAYRGILDAVRAAAPDASIDGLLVSPMRSGGVELVVGVVTDVDWGPLLAVGLGGVLVEVLDDVALRRLPVDAGEIRGMFDQLRGRAVLDGVRGGAAVDFDAAVAAVLGPDLESLEINPLRVAVDGVEALDAVLTWRSRVDDDAPEPQPEGTRR
jgi:succinyl-CoA synthetase beta subunit